MKAKNLKVLNAFSDNSSFLCESHKLTCIIPAEHGTLCIAG
jgi:hypothetical protein